MEVKHILFLGVVLVLGYLLGRHFPTALPTVGGI